MRFWGKWGRTNVFTSPSTSRHLKRWDSLRRGRFEQRYRAKVNALVVCNAGKLREAVADRIDDAFRRFARAFDARLHETIRATHGAAVEALRQREDRSNTTDAAAAELAQRAVDVERLAAPDRGASLLTNERIAIRV